MRLVTQAAVVAALVGLGAAAWYGRAYIPFLGGDAPAQAGPARPARPPVPVEIAKVRVEQITAQIEAVGTARANEAVTITAKSAGIIRAINFQEGQKVATNAILVEMDAGENEARLSELRAARDSAQTALERTRSLFSAGTIARARLDEAEKVYEQADARVKGELAKRADLTIRAPFAGRLGLRQVSVGALVRPGDVITTLDDMSVVKLEFELPQTVLGSITVGTKIAAETSSHVGRKFEGQVQIVDSRVDPVTRAIKVRAVIPNADEALKPGMFMSATVGLGARVEAVMLPEESIVSAGSGQFVFLIRENRAVRTKVRLGRRVGPLVEVLEGVQPGADVAVAGLQQLRDGANVRVVPPVRSTPPTAGQPPAPTRG